MSLHDLAVFTAGAFTGPLIIAGALILWAVLTDPLDLATEWGCDHHDDDHASVASTDAPGIGTPAFPPTGTDQVR